ncbi:crotonase/enoyl-CoA hydratase family protein [Aestuariirhabdus litorea]|uniref:Crotonase/enoyl-CoA hydratase family protein n=1 Tax=Aestuariirhabdus litorea TaxID=2528527 RepID=A0A3P3VPD7_9GAMM|nr:crotonase/enoyl-CoA hydratase family protein [Aestuariirhabdus litorea]RRJ84284.1 crotonase/enoyl-CoA hydratase family protein [Aestuariirhabdus litorea]RWW97506.1 crotonase/enoyl-CoA hydratase family protein [Endozoicomonadaceae bacterium GTF-13]
MSELVNLQLDGKVATVTLNNGKVNAISPEVIVQLNEALDRVEAAGAVLVLAGSPGILSGGYDLRVMGSGADAAIALVSAGSTLARRLLCFPTPVVVACEGHAVAKGAFLLLSGDLRIAADGDFKIGLNEVAIGMTMHHAGITLARQRLTPAAFERAVVLAEMMDPKQAQIAGFVDQVVPAASVLATAQQAAQVLSRLDMKAHYQTKLKTRKALLDTLDQAIELDKQQLI